jgi:hypothetical protein
MSERKGSSNGWRDWDNAALLAAVPQIPHEPPYMPSAH